MRLEVGRIGRAHGLHGEVSVTLTSNRAERLDPGATLYAGDRLLRVESSRRHGPRWIVRFDAVDDRTAAERLTGTVLSAEPLESSDDELWAHELVGCEVVDRRAGLLGRVVAIEANPAHDLLVIDDELLVPMVFVVEHRPGRVVVEVPDGLLDVNRR